MSRTPQRDTAAPNDYHAPLDELDAFLDEFAAEHGLQLDRPIRGMNRQFRCDDRIIELHLDGDNDGKWYFWISVSEEPAGNRYWKRRNLNGPVCRQRLQADLTVALSAAWDEISRWAGQDAAAY